MSILLVEDHTLFREALVPLLGDLSPETKVIEAATEEEAISATEYYWDLDLILLDLVMPGCDGFRLLGRLTTAVPKVPIVILSGENDPRLVMQALEAGARGYIPKSATVQGAKNALRMVLGGETYVPLTLISGNAGGHRQQETGNINGDTGLTPRQLDVLQLLSGGLPNKLIARRLDLNEGTVKLHVSAILRSLGIRNRTQAVREAERRGLLNGVGDLNLNTQPEKALGLYPTVEKHNIHRKRQNPRPFATSL